MTYAGTDIEAALWRDWEIKERGRVLGGYYDSVVETLAAQARVSDASDARGGKTYTSRTCLSKEHG